MSVDTQKMKLRRDLISILNKYQKNSDVDNNQLKKDIDKIKSFKDKDYIAKTILKEMVNSKTSYSNVCAIILIETTDNDTFEKQAVEFLKNPKIEDEKKFFIISVLKQKGLRFDYNDLENYMENPEQIAHSGVENFLKDAMDDPEVQLDLMDFYINIPHEEKIYLLNNLLEEFKGDDLANALSILVHLDVEEDELEYMLNGLLQSKSPYAIEGLEEILNSYDLSKDITRLIKKNLKELKFAHPKFKNVSIAKKSKIKNCYISLIDGKSDFSLALIRERKDRTLDCIFLTINILKGITSCMGFGGINKQNYLAVMTRLFADFPPVEIEKNVLKSLCEYYFKKNIKTKTQIPYEYIIWKNLLNDIEEVEGDLSEYLNSKLKKTILNEKKARKLSSTHILSKWYYLWNENKYIDEILKKIENLDDISIEKIDIITKSEIKNFTDDKEFMQELTTKLLLQSYVAHCAKIEATSSVAYSMCFDNPYKEILIQSIIDKSIYSYFANNLEENDNIFENSLKTKFNKDTLSDLMKKLEAKWK